MTDADATAMAVWVIIIIFGSAWLFGGWGLVLGSVLAYIYVKWFVRDTP